MNEDRSSEVPRCTCPMSLAPDTSLPTVDDYWSQFTWDNTNPDAAVYKPCAPIPCPPAE